LSGPILTGEKRDAAQSASMQDIELLFRGDAASGGATELCIEAAHAAHDALSIAFVRNIERRKCLEIRGARLLERARNLEEFPRADVIRKQESRQVIVIESLARGEVFREA
jgi:hypothetical protein